MLDFKFSLLIKIISSIFYIVSGIVWKKLLIGKGKNYHYIFFRVIATFFFLFLIKIYFQNDISYSILSFNDWFICISVCLFSFWGLYFYTEALKNGRISFITPLNGVSPLFSFVASLVIFNEVLSISKYISLFLILTGLLIHQRDKLVDFTISKEVLFTLLFSIIWGISFVLYLIPIKKFGVINFSIILEICVFVSCVGILFFKEKRLIPPKQESRKLLLCLLMGFLVAGGSLLSNYTLTQLPVSLNIIIGLLFEIIVLVVGLYFFREKLNKKDWILIVFASISALFLFF